MSKRIYKYPTTFGLFSTSALIDAPTGKVVMAEFDGETSTLTVWIEFEDGAKIQPRHFGVFGTGADISGGWQHIASHRDAGGFFVWHIYEEAAS